MKKLLITNSQIDADLIMGILEEEKIVADLRYVGSGSYLNIVGGDMGYAKEVWVADSDYERAISVLKETDFLENKQNEKIKSIRKGAFLLPCFCVKGCKFQFLYSK